MSEIKDFQKFENRPINEKLDNLESMRLKVEKIREEEATVIKQIRDGFVDSVVIFIDLVDSTQFKIDNQDEPEKWILRIKQFSQIIQKYIESSNGKVVKYIGDEVMGIFDQSTQIVDALNLINRIENIQSSLSEITGFSTKIKIALDCGKVFLLKYEGHSELDPQGTPIDRCARIGKHCTPSSILSSYEFVSKCTFQSQWSKIGTPEMKGLGIQTIYQYGEPTIEIKKRIEVDEELFNEFKSLSVSTVKKNQDLSFEKEEMASTITQLQQQLKEVGEKPIVQTDFSKISELMQKNISLKEIMANIEKIKDLIREARVGMDEYGRFLFLNETRQGDIYDRYRRDFTSSIERNLVFQRDNQEYYLNLDNKRNRKVTTLINETQILLDSYVFLYDEIDERDLCEYTFSDAEFWEKYLNINVT